MYIHMQLQYVYMCICVHLSLSIYIYIHITASGLQLPQDPLAGQGGQPMLKLLLAGVKLRATKKSVGKHSERDTWGQH